MNIKQNKGIGLADAIIAIGIFIIFTGVIISISYNIYIQSNFIKRNEQATNYIVEIFEYAQGLVFEDPDPDNAPDLDNYLNSDNLVQYINDKYDIVNAKSGEYKEETEGVKGYKIFINVYDVNNYDDSKKTGYIKQVDVTVEYKLGGKVKTVNMATLINK